MVIVLETGGDLGPQVGKPRCRGSILGGIGLDPSTLSGRGVVVHVDHTVHACGDHGIDHLLHPVHPRAVYLPRIVEMLIPSDGNAHRVETVVLEEGHHRRCGDGLPPVGLIVAHGIAFALAVGIQRVAEVESQTHVERGFLGRLGYNSGLKVDLVAGDDARVGHRGGPPAV